MGILSVSCHYTACGGVVRPIPFRCAGCRRNNQQVTQRPLYMGWRRPRTDDEYYAFVDEFIQAVKQRWQEYPATV